MDRQNNSRSVANRKQKPVVQPNTELDVIFKRSLFWRPTYIAQSAWLEHIPFAFWLVESLRPRKIVELGTHYGSSYFSFCQAVTKLDLETLCFAVDTWGGDEHAGLYGEEVYGQVSEYNQQHYSSFSTLIRSTFDQALAHFPQGSIDLLHIDGLHTLDAVRHDFESWLPKLSDRAVVIMHDTNVRERGFGVFQLLDELKQQYPHFEFAHGHGLGVIGVGSEQVPEMKNLYDLFANARATKQVQDIFSRLGKACGDSWENSQLKQQLAAQRDNLQMEQQQLHEQQALERGRLAERITAQHHQLTAFERQLEESKVQEAQLAAQQQRAQALASEVEMLQQQAADTHARLAASEQQCEEGLAAKQSLESALSQATQQLAQTAEELTQLAGEKASLIDQQAQAHAELQALQGQLKQQQEHAIAHEQARHQLQQQFNDQTLQLNEETQRTAQLTQALGNSNLALTEGSRQLADLQHQLEQSLRTQHAQARSLAEQDDTIKLLQERAKALLQELQDQNETKSQLQQAYSLLESQHDALSHERDALRQEQRQLNEQIELGRCELQMLQQQQATVVEEHQQLQSHSDTLSRNLASQREQHDAAQHAWQQQELRLNTELNEQQQQIGELHRALNERFGETAILTQQLEEQAQHIAEHIGTIDAQEIVRQQLAAELASTQQQWQSERTANQHVSAELAASQQQVDALNQALSERFDETATLTRLLEEQAQLIAKHTHTIKQQDAVHQQLQSHCDTLSRDLVSQREQHDAAQHAWQQQELRLNTELNDQQQQIGELHQALSERFGETAVLTRQLEEQAQHIAEHISTLNAQEVARQQLAAELASTQQQWQSERTANQHVSAELAASQQQVDALNQALSERFDETATLTRLLEEQTQLIAKHTHTIKQQDAAHQQLATTLSAAQQQVQSVQAQYQQAQAELASLGAEKQQQIDALEQGLNERFTEIASLTHWLEERDQSLASLTAEKQQIHDTLLAREQTWQAERAKLAQGQADLQQQLAASQQRASQQQATLEGQMDELTTLNKGLEANIAERFAELATMTRHMEQLTRQLQQKEQQVEQAKERAQKLKKTVSWKLTAPVRALGRTFKESPAGTTTSMSAAERIAASGLFDELWYLHRYPEVADAGVPAIEHFIKVGADKGYSPSEQFDTRWYLQTYPDVAQGTINPLLHYIMHGKAEQRHCLPANKEQ
ncbi:class I SAM-dependent methyltransferase [Aeromonas caviae]|uniref:Class I SAM-dependent methyltransferase n=1 Tax=Aeromonas caviae TaxID=648 RepID=A0ABU5WEB7_AERCA|nr:class I SAM-dependent methyltransferase [Aeromonas caviae]MEA9437918.1 class I SAM-dependent methyltransferase [Aeromonas caviae]